jgi:epoxyqueuosine reductase QueG
VFGSLVINRKEQMNNPDSVYDALEKGIRILYMPTIYSKNDSHSKNGNGISILQDGDLHGSLKQILKKVADHDCTVATGHISRSERNRLLEYCFNIGLHTVVVTHPEYPVTEISVREQQDIVKKWPNVMFERTLYSVLKINRLNTKFNLNIDKRKLKILIEGINVVGPERTILSSDLGQPFNMRPTQGFEKFLKILQNEGISGHDMALMTKVNPLRCLNYFNKMIETALIVSFEQNRDQFKTRFKKPLIGFAESGDPLFAMFKKVVNKNHLLPSAIQNEPRSVISIYLPFDQNVVQSNKISKKPSYEWCLAYTDTNNFLNILSADLGMLIEQCGFKFGKQSAFHHLSNNHEKKISVSLLTSQWSQRHVAYACGLGTFGINNMLITKSGCAGRFTSLVTTMPLIPSPKLETELCLAKKGGHCYACIKRCPASAISFEGFDRLKCWQYLIDNNIVSQKHNIPVVNVCGKCCTQVPCSNG